MCCLYMFFEKNNSHHYVINMNHTIVHYMRILFTENATFPVLYKTPQSSVIINLSQIDYNIVLDNLQKCLAMPGPHLVNPPQA